MGVSSCVAVGRALFTLLGCTTLAVVVYTVIIDGLPFRKELLTPWMAATLVDFYINVVPIAVFVAYKESSILTAGIWIVLLICFGRFYGFSLRLPLHLEISLLWCLFVVVVPAEEVRMVIIIFKPDILSSIVVGRTTTLIDVRTSSTSQFGYRSLARYMEPYYSELYYGTLLVTTTVVSMLTLSPDDITTCAYVVLQLCQISSRDPIQYLFYNVVLKNDAENDSESKCCSALVGRIAFSLLGFLMLFTLVYTILTDGSPFRKELLTPWMVATLIDFYVNVIVISTWVAHKETTWMSAVFWILLLICLGSITTCVYIVVQLFKIAPEDPFQLIYLQSRSKQVRSTIS